jgi:ParB/RepB/Spo0J family partition protein
MQQSEFRHMPIAQLRVSATLSQVERRGHLDKKGLAELAESIGAVGILQPLVVRQRILLPEEANLPEERRLYEIVAGERRFLAAKAAKLDTVPVTVRQLTDEQVLEVQLVENLQREDVHPMAEAEGYEGLRKLGRTVDEIADKVGKSKAYVYARMKLLDLCKEARSAYYAGKLTASTALYIARIPEALQKQALKEITELKGWGDDKSPMSARAAAKHIQENYMLRLSDAGFKTEDADLVPAAGACGACPKRTGNQSQLFGDVKGADVCTDPVCFRQKVAAHGERAIASAAETGQKVIAGKEAEKITKHGTESYELERVGLIRLDARDYQGKGTYRQTLGKGYVPTLLQDPDSGKLIEVAPAKDVDKAHGNNKKAGESRESQRQAAERRKGEQKHKAAIAYRVALFKAIHAASAKTKALVREDYNQLADRLLERLDHDSKKRLFAALGWEVKKKGYSNDFSPPTPFDKMQIEQLLQFVRVCSLAGELQVWQHSGDTKPKDMEAAAKHLGVDAAKIKRELEGAAKAKADARSKKAKSPAKKK